MERNRRVPPRVTLSETGNRWLPPKALGGNLAGTKLYFRHNGQSTTLIPQLPQGPQIRLYACCSLYHDRGEFWIVPFDATRRQIGNGLDSTAATGNGADDDSGSETESDNENDDPNEIEANATQDWIQPTFHVMRPTFASYIGREQQYRRLGIRRADQTWATQLFPHGYQARQECSGRQYGGLVGDLPLLLGLMVFSMPAPHVHTQLASCLGHTWRCPPLQQFPQACGCKSRGNELLTSKRLTLIQCRGRQAWRSCVGLLRCLANATSGLG